MQITLQHDAGGIQCETFYQYVAPTGPGGTISFHNFDMDNRTRLRYYAPSDTVDATATTGGTVGSLSGNARWNGSSNLSRVGDTITDPESGWWAIVSCITDHNQFILEGQTHEPLYVAQPPTPQLAVTKDDGVTHVTKGGQTTYTVTVANTSAGATAGAASAVVVTDALAVGTTFVSCGFVSPAAGTCSEGVESLTDPGVAGAAV
jgi:uncharacterized repeat protein (TIGR01451 family)